MLQRATGERSFISARKFKPLNAFDAKGYRALDSIGIHFSDNIINKMMVAMDALQPTVTQGSITTPVQFLQNFLPGFVKVITNARRIDELVGLATSGSWEDEEIVQQILELTGRAVPFGDLTTVPFSSWNANFVKRTIVRFEEGMQVPMLEEARAARMRVDTAGAKRESAALALEIERNLVGFFGFNNGNNLTYGFLTDPGLPAYVTVPNGVSGSPLWSRKTFLEITADIRNMIVQLRTQSGDQIDPERLEITLALGSAVVDYLTVTSDFGISVRNWIQQTFPRVRIVSAPELNAANGGANVGYMYAETIDDLSTDDGRTFTQVVPAKFLTLGVARLTKSYEEDYSNATAGVMCKRPWAVTRVTGI